MPKKSHTKNMLTSSDYFYQIQSYIPGRSEAKLTTQFLLTLFEYIFVLKLVKVQNIDKQIKGNSFY